MKLPEWIRYLPHPGYGNYGGRNRCCQSNRTDKGHCPLPVDAMDRLFQKHDHDLREARRIYSPGVKREKLIQKADEDLARGLRNLHPWKGYRQKIWGPIYRILASIPFRA